MQQITNYLLISLFLVLYQVGFSQEVVNGTVTDDTGEPLIGAVIQAKDTEYGSITDASGNFTLQLPAGTYTFMANYVGYDELTKEVTIEEGVENVVDFVLSSTSSLNEVVVIGSRSEPRTLIESPTPVDVIDFEELSVSAPQTNVNQQLQYAVPSFSANTQTITDGTDHIDPASLRGLGPDQVLVLVNGKRRHTSSLINLNGSFGRGSVGTDLNAIPPAAIDRIEVLRDGAAAQYGSDAIAGVINIILKEKTNQLTASASANGFLSKYANQQTGGLDGEEVNIDLNYGIPIGQQGGFVNFTGMFTNREHTNRMKEWEGSIFNAYNAIERVATNNGLSISSLSDDAIRQQAQQVSYFSSSFQNDISNASNRSELQDLLSLDVTEEELAARGLNRSDFNMRVGQSGLRSNKFFTNLSIPTGEHAKIYAFGGLSKRSGDAAGFYRLPNQSRTYTPVYLNGFLPEIHSVVNDRSLSAGIKSKLNDWNVDFSNTIGQNSFDFIIENTANATLQNATPTTFQAGGFSFLQNTTNLDLSRFYDEVMSGLNLAFGAESRIENYQIIPGAENSYASYDINEEVVTVTTPEELLVTDFFGNQRPGGAQVFPGFREANETMQDRNSVALYGDVEANITDDFLMSGALRFENYSDFGSTVNGKFSTRYKISDDASVRGNFSTGFRAPSLHQLYFNSTATLFEDGVPREIGTFANNSRLASLFEIPELQEEQSNSVSVGFTGRSSNKKLSLTIDGYLVQIDDRVVLTDDFSGGVATDPQQQAEIEQRLNEANANSARFFSNAIDTRTFGVDFVASYESQLGESFLKNSLSGTFAKTELDKVNVTSPVFEGLESVYFSPASQVYLENAVPNSKVILSHFLSGEKLNVFLSNTWFGEVTNPSDNLDLQQVYDPRIITDLSLGYDLSEAIRLTVASNNLLDVYPERNIDELRSGGRFPFPRAAMQYGFNGRKVLARINLTLGN